MHETTEYLNVVIPHQIFSNTNQIQVMSLSNSSSNSNYLSEQKCENEDKDFLIDDDYNDQQELTFYGQEDSLDESIFDQVDSLLLSRKECQEREQQIQLCENLVSESEMNSKPVEHCKTYLNNHDTRLKDILEESYSKAPTRHGSLDTLSGHESFISDDCYMIW